MQADPGFDLRIADMPIGHGVCAPRSGATNAPPLRGFHSAQVRVFHNHRTTSRMPAVVQSAHCADGYSRAAAGGASMQKVGNALMGNMEVDKSQRTGQDGAEPLLLMRTRGKRERVLGQRTDGLPPTVKCSVPLLEHAPYGSHRCTAGQKHDGVQPGTVAP